MYCFVGGGVLTINHMTNFVSLVSELVIYFFSFFYLCLLV